MHSPCQLNCMAVYHLLHGPPGTRYPPEAESPPQYASVFVRSMTESSFGKDSPSNESKPFQPPYESSVYPFW